MHMKRTNLVLDEDLLEEAQRLSGVRTFSRTVDRALVLQGIDREEPYRLAREAMWALPVVELPLGRPVVEEAVDLNRRARRGGVTVRASRSSTNGTSVEHRSRMKSIRNELAGVPAFTAGFGGRAAGGPSDQSVRSGGRGAPGSPRPKRASWGAGVPINKRRDGRVV